MCIYGAYITITSSSSYIFFSSVETTLSSIENEIAMGYIARADGVHSKEKIFFFF